MTFRKLNRDFFIFISSFLRVHTNFNSCQHLPIYTCINFQLTIIPKIKKQILLFTLYHNKKNNNKTNNKINLKKFSFMKNHRSERYSFISTRVAIFYVNDHDPRPFNSLPKMNGTTVKSSIDRLPVNRSCCTDHLRHRFPRIIVHDRS